jgi:hypothetical protein
MPVIAALFFPDGRLELFGTGADGALHTSFQTSVNGSFGGWTSLG